jgi:hypothetical protein
MQNTAVEKESLKSKISQTGFIHLKWSEYKSTENILNQFGEIIQQTEIRENPKSTRLLASNKPMGFHTDHYSAKYIAWFCNSQSSIGGASLLIDASYVMAAMTPSAVLQLQRVLVRTHQVFYTDKLSLPMLTFEDGSPSVYYAKWLVNNPYDIKAHKALGHFEELIEYTEPIKVMLSEGDILIIDNHRMLHGRDGFPEKSNRWLTRYWLKQSTINI